MPVWAVTGKLGSGKTLCAVDRILKYLKEGRRVATNLDLKLEKMCKPFSKSPIVYRIPDVPTSDDFANIGLGYDGQFQGDEKNGLVVLDECAKWLNSRDWSNKERKKLIDYFVHLRKKRWDMILIIQDIDALDKQFRDLYCEQIVFCSRLDRYNIPFIGGLLKFLNGGDRLPMPRVHIGAVYYNIPTGLKHIENWFYRCDDIMHAYDTEQAFSEFDSPALHQLLTPWHLKGRYINNGDYIKEKLSAIKATHVFLIGLLCGGFALHAYQPTGENPDRGHFLCSKDWEHLFGDCTLTKSDVRKMVKRYKAEQSENSPSSPSGEPGEGEAAHPLQGVYISGSVQHGTQFEYVFSIDGEHVYPESLGYRIYDNNECSAYLLNRADAKDRIEARCN